MNDRWDWNGARWWKFDFHTHTPVSDEYGRGAQQAQLKQRTPKEWLLDYMRAGIHCVAVTDHNTGAWIDELRNALKELDAEKPTGYNPLYLFPGVELSVNGGIHVLAIFGCEKTTSDVDSLLGAVGFGGTKGSSNAVTTKTFGEVVAEIIKAGGIPIPAHVDETSGLFTLSGQTLQQALGSTDICAMEMVNQTYSKPPLYDSSKLSWTEVLGSDCHHPSGNPGEKFPGSRFTWIKMGLPSIEGLRLALLDGQLSVLRSDKAAGYPNACAEMAIEAIEVENAYFIGRPPFRIDFNPWMNAFIGGRGTGKSTLIEFLRIAMRRESELPEELRHDFEKYGQVHTGRDEPGLLTDSACIRVMYRKNGVTYRIQWNPRGTLEPIEEKTETGWQRSEGDVKQRFPIRIYSQKQVFQLAKASLALLDVIDDAPEVGYAEWKRRYEAEERQYLSLRAKIREMCAGFTEEVRLKGELDDVKRKLAVFEQSGHAATLKVLQVRRRQLQAVETWEGGVGVLGQRMREMADAIVPEDFDASSFDTTRTEDGGLVDAVNMTTASIIKLAEEIRTLGNRADTLVAQWREKRQASEWLTAVNQAVAGYDTLTERLKSEGVDDSAAYGILVQQRQTIEKQIKDLDTRRTQVALLEKQAAECLDRVLSLRKEITRNRQQFLAKTLEGNAFVRISVSPYGAKELVEGEFRSIIQRDDGTYDKDIGNPDDGGLLGGLYANDPNVTTIEQRLAEMKTRVRQITANPQQADVTDKRFASYLADRLPSEALDRLDLWFPEDSLDVQYSTSSDQNVFRPIHEGSPGQKTAALLAFLLTYGEEPLILDQPEDDLDNHLIYDLIVTQLRMIKRRRQVLVVTHNANIVVNGDAELVVALKVQNGQTQQEAVGCLQEKSVRRIICQVMEGGEKAFKQRYRRIALEVGHV